MISSEQRPQIRIDGIPDFWERVRKAPHRLLAIDYDGTLAPFHDVRELATPLAGAADLLAQISGNATTSVAILSGRPVDQILDLMGRDLGIPIFGSHGYEYMGADGTVRNYPPTDQQQTGLDKAIALAVDAGYDQNLERKSASIALHTRTLPDPEETELLFMDLWHPIADEYKLSVMRFNRGVELHAEGRHKGVALADLHIQMPDDTLPVYIGDDTTDEDAFRYVKSRGYGIKVGAGDVPTAAAGRVPNEAAVLTILQDWLHVTAD